MEQGDKEMHQLELPPEFGVEKEEPPKPKPKGTLRRWGSTGDYLPGIKREEINLEGLGKLVRAMAKGLGRKPPDITHQPELEGLEEENKVQGK